MIEQGGKDSQLTVDEALDQADISPLSDAMFQGVELLFSTVSSTETVNYIPIPEIAIPSLTVSGVSTPKTVLFEEQDYDITPVLESKPIKTLCAASKVMYYIFFFCFIIDYGRNIISLILTGTMTTLTHAADKLSDN